MSLEESLEQFSQNKQNEGCPVGRLILKLNDADKKALDNAFQKSVPSVTITSALRKEGYKIAETSISNHRKNMCKCAIKE